jgi:hypothetical protein
MGRGRDAEAGGPEDRAVLGGDDHQGTDPAVAADQVDHGALGRQDQGAGDRAAVTGGDAALLVEMRQAAKVQVAAGLADRSHHQVALRPLPHHLHGPGVQQVAQPFGGDHVGLLAGLDPGPAGGPAAEAGHQAGQEQQAHRGQLLGRVDAQGLVGGGEEPGVGEGSRQRRRQPGRRRRR